MKLTTFLAGLVIFSVYAQDLVELIDIDCEDCFCDGGISCRVQCEAQDEDFFGENPSCAFKAMLQLTHILQDWEMCGTSESYIAKVPAVRLDGILEDQHMISDNLVVSGPSEVVIYVRQIQECSVTDRFALQTVGHMPPGCPVLTAPGDATVITKGIAAVIQVSAAHDAYHLSVIKRMNPGTLLEITPPAGRCGGELRDIHWKYTVSGHWRVSASASAEPETTHHTTGVATTFAGAWMTAVAVLFI